MPSDKRKKKGKPVAVVKKAKNIVINIKTGGAKRRAPQPRALRSMMPAPSAAPQLAPTSINIAVSQQQQQQGQFGIPFRARPPSTGTNVVATYKSPLARFAPPPAQPIIIQQAPSAAPPTEKKERDEPRQPVQPTEAQNALTRRVGQLEQYGRQIYTMVAPLVQDGGGERRRASRQVSVHQSNDDALTDASVPVMNPRPLISPTRYAGILQQGGSAPRPSPVVSSSEEQGFEADQDVFSDPQAHFAAQYIHSAAAPEKGGRGRPRLTPSQLEQRAADKALSAAAKKPRGVKAGTGWTAARRAAFEAKKLLTGMPMQTQEQAAAVMQADIAPSLRQPKKKSKTGAGAIRLNPALSGSDQVSMLSQAGAAAATQPQSRGRSMEQMARGGGGGSSNDSFHSFDS
jgi:hypothetical protein